MIPPFSLQMAIPANVASYRLEIRLHPHINSVPNSLTGKIETMNPSDEMVRLFAMCAECQMFRSTSGDAHSKFHLVSGGRGKSGDVWTYIFDVSAVAPEAYRVLLSLLAQAVYQGDPLTKVEISIQNAFSVPLIPQDVLLREDLAIPRTPSLSSVSMHTDQHALESGCFEIRVEFETDVKPLSREAVERALGAWDEVRVFGGFILDFREQEDTGNLGSISLSGSNTVRNWITDFYEGEFSGLTMIYNLALAIHEHTQRVRGVVCE